MAADDKPFVPLRPIAIKERAGIIFLRYGELDVIDGAFVLVDAEGVRVQIPVGGLACIMLEPGTRVQQPEGMYSFSATWSPVRVLRAS